MKRLFLKNLKIRKHFNSLNTKLNVYLNDFSFLEKNFVYNQCFFTKYSKNIITSFHLSAKSFKNLASSGRLPGITHKS